MSEPPDPGTPAGAKRVPLPGCLLRVFLAALLGIGAGVLLALIMTGRLGGDGTWEEIPFDAAVWLDREQSTRADEHFHSLRQAMARDVVDHVLKPGLRQAEVRGRLGEPSRWPVFDAAAWWGPEDEAYYLGKPFELAGRGDDWLWLDYDAQGTLLRAKVLGENADREREP